MKFKNIITASILTVSIGLPGVTYAQSRVSEDMPPPGESVTLENFDEYMNELDGQIRVRLGQLTPGGTSDDVEGLNRPNTDDYATDLEILSKTQRDTKVLEAMLAKAQLAKQVWSEVHSNPTEQYEQRIRQIQDQLNSSMDEMRISQEEFQIEKDELILENETLEERLAVADKEISDLRDQLFKEGMNDGTSAPGLGMPALPKLTKIVRKGSRYYATMSYPDGSRSEVTKGDNISGGVVIENVLANEVIAYRNGTRVYFDKGAFEPSIRSNPNVDNTPIFNQPNSIIDDAANFANN